MQYVKELLGLRSVSTGLALGLGERLSNNAAFLNIEPCDGPASEELSYTVETITPLKKKKRKL